MLEEEREVSIQKGEVLFVSNSQLEQRRQLGKVLMRI